MSNLYNLLESENISNDLKVEMLYRIAESLGEEISEEEINELDKTFNLFGHNISIKKNPDHLDMAQALHAKEPEATEAPKTEATRRTVRAPKVIGLLRRSRDTRNAILQKYGRNNTEAPKAEEAPKTSEVKDNVVKGDFSKPQAKDSYAKAVQYMSTDKPEAVKNDTEVKSEVTEAPKVKKTTKKTTKMGNAIKGAIKQSKVDINNEVTAPAKRTKGTKKK